MILDFGSYIINEASLKKFKRQVHGSLNMSARKRMRKELRGNIITFKFKKRNGEIRTAHGTLHPDYLPALKGGAPRPERQMVYYDLDKEGWRSFRSYSFIKILNVKPVTGGTTPTSTKPVSKPVHKEEEEEEVKKTTVPTKEVEKEEKKKVHSEEKKSKKKLREMDDELEDDDDKTSMLDDKNTPEEDEVIKKDEEKKKEERGDEEDDEKKKDKESEDE